MKRTARFACVAVLAALVLAPGCSKAPAPPAATNAPSQPAAGVGSETAAGADEGMKLCNFKGGPDNAPVKVMAFYPGRHDTALATVKGLIDKYPGKVQVEIVDWRTEEGIQRRNQAGLTCAGITINGKNTFDLVEHGKPTKVLFVKDINGEWTADDLYAAVKQQLDAAEKPAPKPGE